MRTEDGHLVYECLNGDKVAFGILVDKYKESIYALAYSKLGNFQDAEDVTQEVFIKAYQKLRSLKRWDSFHAWLYAITANICKNWIRAKSKRPDRHFVEDQSQSVLDYPSVDSYQKDSANESLYATLHEALDLLPEIYRQAVSLYYLGDMNTREIAKFLGTSANVIEQRLKRARAKLKEEIIAMMTANLDQQKLQAGFTFRIMEIIKHIRIQTIPRIPLVPWGIPIAGSILIVILSLTSHIFPSIVIGWDSMFPDIWKQKAKSIDLNSGYTNFSPYLYKGELLNYAVMSAIPESLSGGSEKKGDKNTTGQTPKDKQLSMAMASGSGTGAIKGKVTDTFTPKAHNLDGAIITAENKELLASEGGKRSVTSDANGEYEIGNLPAGQYLVTTSKEGYINYEDYVTVFAGGESFHDARLYVMGTQTPILKEYVAIPNPYVSSWLGTAKGVGTNLIIIFKEENPESPSSKVTMDISAQNLKDIAVDKFERLYNSQPERIHIEVKSISFVYDGVNTIKLGFPKKFKGVMKLNGVTYTLMLEKEAQNPEPPNLLKHPQEPVKPYPYKEEEITYKSDGIEINGTLTYPDSKGPFPAVILLSDSGYQDRNGTIGGHRPLFILADYLTRNGIAVLRTDDRQAGALMGDFYDSSYEDLAGDTIAGIQYLKSRKEINPKQIGLISMGQGSSIASITVNRSQDVKFIVMLNGIGLSAEETTLSYLDKRLEIQPSEELLIRREFLKRLSILLKQEKDIEAIKGKIPDLYTDSTIALSKTKLTPEEEKAMRTSAGDSYVRTVNTYYRSYMTYDPQQDLMKLKLPLLVVSADKNSQNLSSIESTLKKGGNKNYTLKSFPNLTFMLQTEQPGLNSFQIEETISPIVLKLVNDWIIEQAK